MFEKKKQPQFGRKKSKKPLLFFFLLCIGSLLFFRDKVACYAVDTYIHYALPKDLKEHLVIGERIRDRGHLQLKNVCLKKEGVELFADSISIYTSIHLFPFTVTSYVDLQNPDIKIIKEEASSNSSSWAFFLLPHKVFSVKLSVDNGSITLPSPDAKKLYFSFLGSHEKNDVGTFYLKESLEDSSPRLCSVSMRHDNGSLLADIDLNIKDLKVVQPLLNAISNNEFVHLDALEGGLFARGDCSISISEGLEKLNGDIEVKNLSSKGENSLDQIQIASFAGTFSYPPKSFESNEVIQDKKTPFWKMAEGRLSFSGANFMSKHLENLHIKNSSGELTLAPCQDPSMHVYALLSSDQKDIPVEIHSSGVLHEDGSFWLQGDFSFDTKGKDKSSVIVSLCKVGIQSYVLQSDFSNIGSEILSLVPLATSNVKIQAQDLEGSLTAWIEDSHFTKLQWNRIKVSKSQLDFSKLGYFVSVPIFSSEGCLVKERGFWCVKDIQASIKESLFKSPSIKYNNIGLDLHFRNNILELSTLNACWDQGQFLMSACGPIDNIQSKLEISSNWSKALDILSKKTIDATQVEMSALFDASFHLGNLQLKGMLRFKEGVEPIGQLAVSATTPLKGNGAIWNRSISIADVKAHLVSSIIGQQIYEPILNVFGNDAHLSGQLAFETHIANAKIKTALQSDDLFFQMDHSALSSGPLERKACFVLYDINKKTLSGQIQLIDGFFAHETSNFTLANIQGVFSFDDGKLKGEKILSLCENINVPFSLYYDQAGLFIETHALETDLSSLCQIDWMKKYLSGHLTKMQGRISLPDAGCNLLFQKAVNEWIWHWKISASVKQLNLPFNENISVTNAQLDLSFDSSTMISSLKNMKGNLQFYQSSYRIALNNFFFDPRKESPFQLQIADIDSTLISLKGQVKYSNGIDLIFDKSSTSFCGIPLLIEKCHFTQNLQLEQFDCGALTSDANRKTLYHTLSKAKCLSSDVSSWLGSNLPHLNGDISAKFSFNELNKLSISLTSPALVWKGQKLNSCHMDLSFDKSLWVVKKLSWNHSLAEFAISSENGNVFFPYFKFSSPSLKFSTEAIAKNDLKQVTLSNIDYQVSSDALNMLPKTHIKGVFKGTGRINCSLDDAWELISLDGKMTLDARLSKPFETDLKFSKEIPFTLDKKRGLEIGRLDGSSLVKDSSEQLIKFNMEKIFWDIMSKRCELKNFNVNITSAGSEKIKTISTSIQDIIEMKADKDWELSGDVAFTDHGIESELRLKSGIYIAAGKEYSLKDPKLQVSSSSLHLRTNLKFCDAMIFCDLQKDFDKNAPLYLLLRPNLESEGLKVLCRENQGSFEIQRVEGKLFGVEANLQKSAHITDGSFFGLVKIDFSQPLDLLPSQARDIIKSLKLGKGYTIQGHFFLPQNEQEQFWFKGDIKGEKCGLFGYKIQNMQMKASVFSQEAQIDDLKIEDPSGQLSVKTCLLSKDEPSDSWQLSMPLATIREFKPSLLEEEGKKVQAKPFLFKNLSVYDLSGTIGDAKSFTGHGALHFVNSTKKEFSFFDIPFEMIKDLGLDSGMFTPISGEASFNINKGRFQFHDLRNSFSESRRAEFYLSDDQLSYIDFEGNYHIDLKMRQRVLLKWSESLILSIRGTLDKPKYSLTNVN